MGKQSHNSVKIVGRQWSLVLPAGQGYDREVLLDHLNEAVQRHGNAELVSCNGSFSIARTAEQSAVTCGTCGATAHPMAGRSGGDFLCMPCILRRMYGRARHRPQLAYGRG